jgi:signal peptidase I
VFGKVLTLAVITVGAIVAPVTVIAVLLVVAVTVTFRIRLAIIKSGSLEDSYRGSGLRERSRSRRLSLS